jgi:uncharacterized membrane protein
MELPMFSTSRRPRRIIWHDIVPVAAFVLALSFAFWTYQYQDKFPKLLPTHWSIDHRVASHEGESVDIPKHRQWTTVWPTVVRFDRPLI